MVDSTIPICPLMSSNDKFDRVCLQERCAWWVKNSKLCSVYLIAHNNLLEIQKKQLEMKKV